MSENLNKRPRNSALHAEHRQRMKNKFLQFGLEPFSDHEIMEMLLYYALPQVDTNEIAHNLINKGGSFVGAFNMSMDDMKKVSGIKDHAATFLKLIPAVAQYYCIEEAKLMSAPSMTYEEVARLCVKSFVGIHKEVLLGFYFDSKMHLIKQSVISQGDLNSVNTTLRSIVDEIIKFKAANIVLAHNHPTISIIPSSDDIDSTLRLQKMLYQFETNLIEHFVVAGDEYQGILKFHEKSTENYDRTKVVVDAEPTQKRKRR